MKKALVLIALLVTLSTHAQSVFGYWYGTGNVQGRGTTNNYLIEMILQPEHDNVTGILNYFFKNTYRSLKVKGKFDAVNRELVFRNVPITFHGSTASMEVDCKMDMMGKLIVAKKASSLTGQFISGPEYKYSCPAINFNLIFNADVSQRDSVLEAIRLFKETYQVWKPALEDSFVSVKLVPRDAVNYVVENKFKERENVISDQITVDNDSLTIDLYDNGEVDGDSVSVFFNNQLITFSQKLSTKAVHFRIGLDPTRDNNELSMFAENLGSIPPNTALMIVSDGKKRYELRITSNLQKNGTIRIRRKKSGS